MDAWTFLDGQAFDDAPRAAELEFGKLDTDPKITADFAAKKGSTPVRLDAPKEGLDQCNILHSLKDESKSVQSPFNISDSDWVRSVWNVMFKFWGDQNMTSDDLTKELKDEYDTIFG